MSKKILVFSESHRLLSELVSGAVALGGDVVAICIGGSANTYIALGAKRVFSYEEDKSMPIEAYADAFTEIAKGESAEIVMIGSTIKGKSLAAIMAQAMAAGASTDCKNIRIINNTLHVDRMIFGGAGVSTEVCKSEQYVITVPPMTFEAAAPDYSRSGAVVEMQLESAYPARVVGKDKSVGDDVDITLANTVVAVGRGLEREEDLAMIKELADVLSGVIGCSRPISADKHWLPHDRYIGLSGKTVKPKLYVCIGISGQIQHIASAQDSKTIVAINKDKEAPVFKVSDYGIVGNMYELVPELVRKLKEIKS